VPLPLFFSPSQFFLYLRPRWVFFPPYPTKPFTFVSPPRLSLGTVVSSIPSFFPQWSVAAVNLVLRTEISPETLCLLSNHIPFSDHFPQTFCLPQAIAIVTLQPPPPSDEAVPFGLTRAFHLSLFRIMFFAQTPPKMALSPFLRSFSPPPNDLETHSQTNRQGFVPLTPLPTARIPRMGLSIP